VAEDGKLSTVGIYDVSPFTMLDYPGKIACLVWFAGCNLRCQYCHNPAMVKSIGDVSWTKVEDFLKTRVGKLNGVVFTGGEATLHPDIVTLAKRVRDMGFLLKLDTNGTRPQVVKKLLEQNLLTYVALDYKAPREAFQRVTGVKPERWDAFSETLDMLIAQTEVPYEVRTTVHTDLMNEADVAAIQADLDARGHTGPYYVQNFKPCEATLGNLPEQTTRISQDALKGMVGQDRVKVEFRNFEF
jgi:pyruvate formate lyase activating enzyme